MNTCGGRLESLGRISGRHKFGSRRTSAPRAVASPTGEIPNVRLGV